MVVSAAYCARARTFDASDFIPTGYQHCISAHHKQASCEPPLVLHGPGRLIVHAYFRQVSRMDTSLPPNWRSARAADGKEYYFNELTGETSWTVRSAVCWPSVSASSPHP